MDERAEFVELLDRIINEGDNGLWIQPSQLPHVPESTKGLVALPSVIIRDCFHLAEIDMSNHAEIDKSNLKKIKHKGVYRREDDEMIRVYRREGDEMIKPREIGCLADACHYAETKWPAQLRSLEPSLITQTRRDGHCTWRVTSPSKKTWFTGHQSEIMELAMRANMQYEDE